MNWNKKMLIITSLIFTSMNIVFGQIEFYLSSSLGSSKLKTKSKTIESIIDNKIIKDIHLSSQIQPLYKFEVGCNQSLRNKKSKIGFTLGAIHYGYNYLDQITYKRNDIVLSLAFIGKLFETKKLKNKRTKRKGIYKLPFYYSFGIDNYFRINETLNYSVTSEVLETDFKKYGLSIFASLSLKLSDKTTFAYRISHSAIDVLAVKTTNNFFVQNSISFSYYL